MVLQFLKEHKNTYLQNMKSFIFFSNYFLLRCNPIETFLPIQTIFRLYAHSPSAYFLQILNKRKYEFKTRMNDIIQTRKIFRFDNLGSSYLHIQGDFIRYHIHIYILCETCIQHCIQQDYTLYVKLHTVCTITVSVQN